MELYFAEFPCSHGEYTNDMGGGYPPFLLSIEITVFRLGNQYVTGFHQLASGKKRRMLTVARIKQAKNVAGFQLVLLACCLMR